MERPKGWRKAMQKSLDQLVADCADWLETPKDQRTKEQAQEVLRAAERWQQRAQARSAGAGLPEQTEMPPPQEVGKKSIYANRLRRAAHLYCWHRNSKAHKVELIRVAGGGRNTL